MGPEPSGVRNARAAANSFLSDWYRIVIKCQVSQACCALSWRVMERCVSAMRSGDSSSSRRGSRTSRGAECEACSRMHMSGCVSCYKIHSMSQRLI